MRLWCEVWDQDGAMLGEVDLAAAVVTRKLDAAGQVKITPAYADPQAASLMQAGRYVHIYRWEQYQINAKELIEIGYLQKRSLNVGAGQKSVQWSGTDGLEALQRYTTYRGRVYDNKTIASVVQDLIDLVPGMGVQLNDVGDLYTTQRFDGVNILPALEQIGEYHGLHFRLAGQNLVQFGPMGEVVPLRVTNLPGVNMGVTSEIALIESLNITLDAFKVVNWIEPVSGPKEGALTLQFATGTWPYPVKMTMGPNGETVYYMEDADSQADYGVWQKHPSPDQLLVPLTATDLSLFNAANVLQNWGATFLRRNAKPKRAYAFSAVAFNQRILPGDKIRLVYDGDLYQQVGQGHPVKVAEEAIDEDVWVVSMTERYNLQGKLVDMDVSNVDLLPENAHSLIARSVMARERDKIAAEININRQSVNDTAELDVAVSHDVLFEVSQEAASVTACKVELTRAGTSGVGNPSVVTLYLDGEEVAARMGYSPPLFWGPAAGTTITVDIVPELLASALGLRGEHTLTIEALYGLPGDLDVKIRLYEVIAGLEEL